MSELYEKKITVGVSMCDMRANLTIPSAFGICMDIASEHAQQLGFGYDYMQSMGRFWITAKTRIHICRFPKMLEDVLVRTWPLPPSGASCIRDYKVSASDGEELLLGKTEWVMMDVASGKLLNGKDVFPEDMQYFGETVLEEPFQRSVQKTDAFQKLGEYTVGSQDIDLGRHMNNTAYIRALFSLLSSGEIRKRNYTDVEILYKKQCFEGERITFYEFEDCGKTEMAAKNDKDETVVSLRLF